MLCAEIVSDIQNSFCTYTTCFPHVLQKEELLTKIYLYELGLREDMDFQVSKGNYAILDNGLEKNQHTRMK